MRTIRDPIRAAEPEDSGFLAWAIVAAARSHGQRGTFDLAVPGSDDDRLDVAEWLVLSDLPSSCRWENFLVCDDADGPVGAMAGYDPGEPGMTSLGPALADAFVGLDLGEEAFTEAVRRLRAYETCASDAEPGTWVVEWVATRADRRRRGVATRLLRRMLERGRARGYAMAQVSTLIGNIPALEAYRRVGFKVVRERRHELFERALGSPGMVQLAVDL